MTYPSTVYAVTIPRNGGIEVLEKTQVPFPIIEPGHLVIKVRLFLAPGWFIDEYYLRNTGPVFWR